MNTIHPIYRHVPDVVLKEDDIVYVDLGPVFGDIEAHFARMYMLAASSCTLARMKLQPFLQRSSEYSSQQWPVICTYLCTMQTLMPS